MYLPISYIIDELETFPIVGAGKIDLEVKKLFTNVLHVVLMVA